MSLERHGGEDMLSAYPIITDIVVRWGDMDSLGHVNNIIYLQYFETARIEYHEAVGIPAPTPTSEVHGVILAAAGATFKVPVTYPDTISIGSRISAMGPDSFRMEYTAVSRKLERIVAEGDALVVLYNFVERRRSPMTPELRERIIALEGHEPPALPPRARRGRATA
jgi:acyl-CoA thioester hydrolase